MRRSLEARERPERGPERPVAVLRFAHLAHDGDDAAGVVVEVVHEPAAGLVLPELHDADGEAPAEMLALTSIRTRVRVSAYVCVSMCALSVCTCL